MANVLKACHERLLEALKYYLACFERTVTVFESRTNSLPNS